MTEAISNARQIGLALDEFRNEYGRFPDSTTAAEVERKSGSTLTLSNRSSNDLFAQLIAANITRTERMFYANAKLAIKPDDVCNTDATALAHGECVFAYISGVDPNANPGTPIAFGPVIPGTMTLDLKSNNGKAAVLRLDYSVTSLPINSSGQILYGRTPLLDPRLPYWNGKAPDVKWPK